jgi:hypothetical protein
MEHATLSTQLSLQNANDPVGRTFAHLLRHPCDLVDARWLMSHLHATPQDVQQAFILLEQQKTTDAQESEQ